MNLSLAILAVSFLPFFEARNQIANFVFDPPPEGKTVKPVLPNLTVTETCPGCDGKGELVLEEPDYGQFKGRIGKAKKIHKQQCQLCGGKGKLKAFMNLKDLLHQVASDYTAFSAEHQGRGEIAIGKAFVTRAMYDKIDKAQRKLVEEAFGHPCKKCNWTGIEACKKCKGKGTIECTQKNDCKGGWLVVYDEGSRRATRKDAKVSVSPCPVCGGANALICPECGGRRAHPCSKCGGLGIKTKGSL